MVDRLGHDKILDSVFFGKISNLPNSVKLSFHAPFFKSCWIMFHFSGQGFLNSWFVINLCGVFLSSSDTTMPSKVQ